MMAVIMMIRAIRMIKLVVMLPFLHNVKMIILPLLNYFYHPITIDNIHNNDTETISEDTANCVLRKDLIRLKGLIQQLQLDQNKKVAVSLETDHKMNILKKEIIGLQRGISSCATIKQP